MLEYLGKSILVSAIYTEMHQKNGLMKGRGIGSKICICDKVTVVKY